MITRVDEISKGVRTDVQQRYATDCGMQLYTHRYVWGYPHSSDGQLHDP